MPDLEFPKPISELTLQELKALKALTSDAVFDVLADLKMLQARYEVISEEISKRMESVG